MLFMLLFVRLEFSMWSSSTSEGFSTLTPTTFDIITFVMAVSHAVLFDQDLSS